MDTSSKNTSFLILGVIGFALSLTQMIVGLIAYEAMERPKLGCWWGGMIGLITSSMAIVYGFTQNHCLSITVLCFTMISVVLDLTGVIVDGIGYGIVNLLVVCYDEDAHTYYGPSIDSAADTINAMSCANQYNTPCACVQGHDVICHGYHPAFGDSCDVLFNRYDDQLHNAYIVDWFALLAMLALSICACVGTCCPSQSWVPADDHQTAAAVPPQMQQLYPQQPAPVMYSQQPAINPQPVIGQVIGVVSPPASAPEFHATTNPIVNPVVGEPVVDKA